MKIKKDKVKKLKDTNPSISNAQPISYFDQVPQELIVDIFEYLRQHSLFAAACVNKRFHKIAQSNVNLKKKIATHLYEERVREAIMNEQIERLNGKLLKQVNDKNRLNVEKIKKLLEQGANPNLVNITNLSFIAKAAARKERFDPGIGYKDRSKRAKAVIKLVNEYKNPESKKESTHKKCNIM